MNTPSSSLGGAWRIVRTACLQIAAAIAAAFLFGGCAKNSEVAVLREEVADLRAELARTKADIEAQHAQTRGAMVDLVGSTENEQRRVQTAMEAVSQLSGEIADLRTEISNHHSILVTAVSDLDTLSARLNYELDERATKRAVRMLDYRISSLESDVSSLKLR